MSNGFSWERYKAGEKVITRDGLEVLHIEKCHANCAHENTITYICRRKDGCLLTRCVCEKGYLFDHNILQDQDLIMSPKTMDLYICIEKDSENILEDCINYDTTPACTKKMTLINNHRFKQVKITVNTETWEQVL